MLSLSLQSGFNFKLTRRLLPILIHAYGMNKKSAFLEAGYGFTAFWTCQE